MDIKVSIFRAIVVILLATTGCTPECAPEAAAIGVGRLISESESVPLSVAASVRAEIFMGGGDLTVTGGAGELLEAAFAYNVAELEPEVGYTGGELVVRHPDIGYQGFGSPWDIVDYRCDWDLRLNDDVPIEMSVTVGTGTAHLDMGSLSLRELEVAMGSGDVTVDVSGASSLKQLTLQIGVGNATLDLTGSRQRDTAVKLEGMVGELNVWLPQGADVRVDLTGVAGKVNANGLTKDGDDYVSSGHPESGPAMRIHIGGGFGRINLEVKE